MQFATLDDFRPHVGQPYEAEVRGGRIPMTLDTAQELPSMGREGGSFRLEFLGPLEPVLPQAIYPIHGGGGRHDIFIVPIGQEQEGIRYEAIFV